jgi:hypothetical protein
MIFGQDQTHHEMSAATLKKRTQTKQISNVYTKVAILQLHTKKPIDLALSKKNNGDTLYVHMFNTAVDYNDYNLLLKSPKI